jgi:peptidylprolyl isomerase
MNKLTVMALSIIILVGVMAIGLRGWTEPKTLYKAPKQEKAMTKTMTGLKYTDLEVGTGKEAKKGLQVVVHYTGSFYPDGKVFDSSVSRGEPFSFRLGTGQVIKGWDEGVEGMKIGGKRHLVIPPELAYGESGAANVIPPNSTLQFDIELLELK